MQRMLKYMDIAGGDGLIQFTEFLVAGCDKRLLLTEVNLQKEFQFLDADQDGYIGPADAEKFMYAFADNNFVAQDEDCRNFKKLLAEIKRANVVYRRDADILSDNTVVKNYRWSGLKKRAMSEDFESSDLWVSIASDLTLFLALSGLLHRRRERSGHETHQSTAGLRKYGGASTSRGGG